MSRALLAAVVCVFAALVMGCASSQSKSATGDDTQTILAMPEPQPEPGPCAQDPAANMMRYYGR